MGYKEWESVVHIDYIHKSHLANQGMTFCMAGGNMDCDHCPMKHPEDQVVKCASAWTD